MKTTDRALVTELSENMAFKALDGLRYWYQDFHTTFTAELEYGKYTIHIITTNGKVSGTKYNQMAAFVQGICYAIEN